MEAIMARTITLEVPINTEDGKKIVTIEGKVSDETITHDGTEFHLVKHTSSGHRYLAEPSVVEKVENSDLEGLMNDLETEEGF